MSCYIYCLYSTEDGVPRYVGKASDKVSYRFKKHIAAALENEPGELYEWVRSAWRSGHDVAFYILQDSIIPKDLDMFEKYWIAQFTNLLNSVSNPRSVSDSPVARDIKAALKHHVQVSHRQR